MPVACLLKRSWRIDIFRKYMILLHNSVLSDAIRMLSRSRPGARQKGQGDSCTNAERRRRFQPGGWCALRLGVSLKRRRMGEGPSPLPRRFRLDEMGGIRGFYRGIAGFRKLQKHLLAFPPRFVDRHAGLQVATQAVAANGLHQEIKGREIKRQDPLKGRHSLKPPVLIIGLRQTAKPHNNIDEAKVSLLLEQLRCDRAECSLKVAPIPCHDLCDSLCHFVVV